MDRTLSVIALYLPQFHPIPENDAWWGRGFTEWTNTAKARPLFDGHYQPHVPADLGFYDLRVPEVRAAQAELARAYGVDAFCYYHYWFGDGRRLLERPFDEVLKTGEPDFPFCICWANETWTGVWHGAPDRILIEQKYPSQADFDAHFEFLLSAFLDRRYVRVNGKPLFVVYRPHAIPDVEKVTARWRERAVSAGLPGLHLVGWWYPGKGFDPLQHGFDAKVSAFKTLWYAWDHPLGRIRQRIDEVLGLPTRYPFDQLNSDLEEIARHARTHHPCVIPNWDNTPRSGKRGCVLTGATPAKFGLQVRNALRRLDDVPAGERVVFVKSWNEWAEGNHLEPDLRDGHAWLEALRDEIGAWKSAQSHGAAPAVRERVASSEQRSTI